MRQGHLGRAWAIIGARLSLPAGPSCVRRGVRVSVITPPVATPATNGRPYHSPNDRHRGGVEIGELGHLRLGAMADRGSTMGKDSVCTLGYHSHTHWLLQPQIILLYDKVEMNRPIYEMIISRGEERRSTLDYRLSQLLLAYEREGILLVKDYEPQVGVEDREMANRLIAYWEEHIPDAFTALALELTKAREKHLERKLADLDELHEPMYGEITHAIRALRHQIDRLNRGEVGEYTREGVRHCLEHVLFTQKVAQQSAIFDWYGYSKLREWLVSVPSFPPFASDVAQGPLFSERTTEPMALNLYFDLFVGALKVTDRRQLATILKQRKELKGARQEIRRMNEDVWQFVNWQDECPRPDVLDEFTSTLLKRVKHVQQQFETVTLEKEVAQKQGLSRIVTATVSTAVSLASIVLPIPGVAEEKLSDWLVERLGKATANKKYSELAWCYTFEDYRRLYERSLLHRASISVNLKTYGSHGEPELREVDFCRTLGISRRTLYEWEDQNLLPPPGRSWQGWKTYSSRHLQAAREILGERPR